MPPLSQASFTSKIDSERRVKVLFFGRNECEFTLKAINHLNRLEFEVTSVFSRERGEVLPEELVLGLVTIFSVLEVFIFYQRHYWIELRLPQ